MPLVYCTEEVSSVARLCLEFSFVILSVSVAASVELAASWTIHPFQNEFGIGPTNESIMIDLASTNGAMIESSLP